MKIPEWLPETNRPKRSEGGSPEPIIEQLAQPFTRFFKIQAAGGIVLLSCAIIALGIANSPWAASFASFWQTTVGVTVGGFALELSLQHWINDGAMTIFFFVVGLEIKRELVHGELREPRKAVLPVVAALGGMLVPAALFLLFQHGETRGKRMGNPHGYGYCFRCWIPGTAWITGPVWPQNSRLNSGDH